jgi:hypothetical protein
VSFWVDFPKCHGVKDASWVRRVELRISLAPAAVDMFVVILSLDTDDNRLFVILDILVDAIIRDFLHQKLLAL